VKDTILDNAVNQAAQSITSRTIVDFDGPIRNLIKIDDLVDINTVVIDTSLPVEEKKRQFIEQIKNPHLYRCGDTIVRISHTNTGVTLADRLKQYLLSGQGLSLK